MRLCVTSRLLLSAVLAAMAASCSCDPEHVSSRVRDRKAYALGEEHAQRVIGLRHSEPALQDALLDVRARMTNIHDRLGAQASADYERGFVNYIKANDDSLARVLF